MAYDEFGQLQVAVFDPASMSITKTLTLLGLYGSFALSADGTRLYDLASSAVPVAVTVTLSVTGATPCNGAGIYDIYQPVLSGHYIYVPWAWPSETSVTVGTAVFDTDTLQSVANWPHAYEGLTVAPGGKQGYGIPYYLGLNALLVKVDLTTGAVVQSLALGKGGAPTYPLLSADGSTIYVGYDGTLYLIDAQTLTITRSVPDGKLGNVAITPDGQYIYGYVPGCSGCTAPNSVSIFSTSSLQMAGTIPDFWNFPARPIFIGNQAASSPTSPLLQ